MLFEKATVLIIDDDTSNIELLSNILKQRYIVKSAISGLRGLKVATSNTPPDLILLDIMMPGLDGYEVCKRLKKDPATANVPVIFVSSKSDTEDEYLGFRAGCVDYIFKPFSPPIVNARVATHIALNKKQKDLKNLVEERTAELESIRQGDRQDTEQLS